MAKKRHVNEQELPFVALMDTMTNVVGVLAIVLVMMGISLARAASRVFSALPPATEEQVRAVQAEIDRLRADQAPHQEKLKSLSKPEVTPAQLSALNAELARIERPKGSQFIDLEALKRELAKRDAELKQKKTAVDQLMADRDRLKALLDTTPTFKQLPVKVVRIPASRPIPQGAKIHPIVVTKDSVHWVDSDGARAAFLNEFKSPFFRVAVRSQIIRDKQQNVTIYDHQELAKYFEKRKLTFRQFRLEIVYYDWSTSPILRMIPAAPPPVDLQYTLQRLKSMPKTVVMFRVTGDGFDNYLGARELCDKVGVPAGWEYAGSPIYEQHMYEIQTNRPKPPPKPVTPPAPGTAIIKSPSSKLD